MSRSKSKRAGTWILQDPSMEEGQIGAFFSFKENERCRRMRSLVGTMCEGME